jgi:hypothetical protein
MRWRSIVPAAAVAIAVATACASSLAGHPATVGTVRVGQLPPLPPPGDFVRTVDNPWFPLRPGTVLTSAGEEDGTPATDVFRVTGRTRTILGVRATVVDDRVFKGGRLTERTSDWYAQDKAGNVWYLGEDTATLKPDGSVAGREGSWEAGVHGARAGILMPAHPRAGMTGRQEDFPGHAEDRYRILSLHARVRTPAVASRHALLVRETTPLEPAVVDHKLYVRGVGIAREQTIRGGNERFDLVRVLRP